MRSRSSSSEIEVPYQGKTSHGVRQLDGPALVACIFCQRLCCQRFLVSPSAAALSIAGGLPMQTSESRVCLVPVWLPRVHHPSSNKAVSDGAVLSYVDPLVTSRASRYTCGVKCRRPYVPHLPDHQERCRTRFYLPSGTTMLPNGFQSILIKV